MNKLTIDIERIRKKLIRGGMRENFGQKELRDLEDKYKFTLLCYNPSLESQAMAQQIMDFREWCEIWEGE